MVQPKEREMSSETLEEGLYRKFGELQIAREDKSATMFDEIAKSIEVRLIAVPTAHDELMKIKEAMLVILYQEKAKISQEAENSIDAINRQSYLNQENHEVEWEFRDIYEEQIMWAMQKYHLVAMTTPMYGMLDSINDVEQSEQIEEYPQEYPQQEIQPQNIQQQDVQQSYKRPHLSIER